jgi:hypothetical protein
MKRIAGIGKQSLIDCNRGCAYANGTVALAEDLDMFWLGAIDTGGRTIPTSNLSFAKRTLVGWMSGS